MSIDKVREYLKAYGRDTDIHELDQSSATVELAAQAIHTIPARIAKTLSFKSSEEGKCILIVTAGDMKIDNSKFKHTFGLKAAMLKGDEVETLTGHAAGGVCPFGNPASVQTYLDQSMKRFPTVYPACGSSNSMIELSCEELEEYSRCLGWVDVCKSCV